jgi:hypothetical protein
VTWDIARRSISNVPALALVGLGLSVVLLRIETQDALSSGKYKTKHPFNPIQIKDGWIVRLAKDGRIKERIEKYPPEKKK